MLKIVLTYLNKNIFYIWLLVFSFITIAMYPIGGFIYGVIGVYALYYLIYKINQKLFLVFIIVITISLSLYYPIYQSYGSLNSGIVAAFLETNQIEALTFIKSLKITSSLIFLFLFSLSAIILIRLMKYHDVNKKSYSNLFFFLVFLVSLVWWPTQNYLEYKDNEEVEKKWTLSISPVNIIAFYADIYESVTDYYIEKKYLEDAVNNASSWNIISAKPKYNNYILVIGESARKDYLSTYGFSLSTTPFMDKTNGYINNSYISAAPATYDSLKHSLYLKNNMNKLDYSYNIITLAKAAGIKTIWLSNQGSIGKYDTIASRMGASADFHFFTKKGGFNTANSDDFKLLTTFMEQFDNNLYSNQSKLFILHLMGSHAKFCDRLNVNEYKYKFVNENLSCYVNTVLKTDRLIEKIVGFLDGRNESYSLIYFSDHGLAHKDKENIKDITLEHNEKVKQSYQVPFFKISSDDSERKVVNVKRSAFNFIYGFAQWLGITTQELDENYNFFSDKDDENIKVFNFKKYIPYEQLEDDNLPQN